MQEGPRLGTRDQYIEMLIDASFRDATALEKGFLSWCSHHVPIWRQLGHDETWIRLRIEAAQHTRDLHRMLKEQGRTMLEIREELRLRYADYPELYDLAKERERVRPGPLQYRGNTSDLRQRYTLRILVYETDTTAHHAFCSWSGRPLPGPDQIFVEQPDEVRIIRDLSTVEELELQVAMSRYFLRLFDTVSHPDTEQIALRMEAYGAQLRAAFIATHGYPPEDSATPYIPVTIDGPQDHDAYYAKEYPPEDSLAVRNE